MNHLHRQLAPVSADAWVALDDEASDLLRHFLAARKLVDVAESTDADTPALATGRVDSVRDEDGLRIDVVRTEPMFELTVPFVLDQREVRALERGALDSDLDPLRDAARTMAAAEDGLVFDGMSSPEVAGITSASPYDPLPIPADYEDYPFAVAAAVSLLKEAGVAGPYGIALGPGCYQGVIETTQHGGQVVFEHLRKILGGPMIWAPSVRGAVVMSVRGDDYHLEVARDHALGYLGHDGTTIQLAIEATVGFRIDGNEAGIALEHSSS